MTDQHHTTVSRPDAAVALATAAVALNQLRRALGLAPIPVGLLVNWTTLADWQARDGEGDAAD